jgi:hypothetical protein
MIKKKKITLNFAIQSSYAEIQYYILLMKNTVADSEEYKQIIE